MEGGKEVDESRDQDSKRVRKPTERTRVGDEGEHQKGHAKSKAFVAAASVRVRAAHIVIPWRPRTVLILSWICRAPKDAHSIVSPLLPLDQKSTQAQLLVRTRRRASGN